jgi:hypothetical protein
MSVAARRRISAAQKKRWAEYRKRNAAVVPAVQEPRRRLSAAAKAHIAAVQRKRWAEYRKKKGAVKKQIGDGGASVMTKSGSICQETLSRLLTFGLQVGPLPSSPPH